MSTPGRVAPIVSVAAHAFLLLLLSCLPSVAAQGSGGPSNGGPNTSLAMIILYAITGCVSALFCVVIVSGAIRAIRYPERYGPRNGDPNFSGTAGQSRARGLTRAILDTFPVVKFGVDPVTDATPAPKDIENPDESYELKSPPHTKPDDTASVEMQESTDVVVQSGHVHFAEREGEKEQTEKGTHAEEGEAKGEDADETPMASSSKPNADAEPAVRPRPRPGRTQGPSGERGAGEQAGEKREVVPDAIGRETCPICILDFEEGDDLRVLPCEGHHRFHRDCVDQWLLELSSSCPICRQDFHALETMLAGDTEHLEPPHMPGAARPLSTAAARFSRYLRFARRRHDRYREDGSGFDITDPPMPLSPDMRY